MPDAIDHVDIRVADVELSRAFWAAALEPLGWRVRCTGQDPAGATGIGEGTTFALHAPSAGPRQDAITRGAHTAFHAGTREAVDGSHAAAVAHGGRDIGAPGPRPGYSAGYYGAFVLDPDGNNIEAVTHAPDPEATPG